METKTKNLIRISPSEIEAATNKLSAIEAFNKKIQVLRKRQLFGALREGTKLRGDLTKKLRTWITMLENRLFDQNTINELDVRQVISLFKYLGQYSIQLMDQVNDVEGLLKAYTDSEKAVDKLVQNNQTNILLSPEQNKVKSELMKAVIEGLSKNAEEAVVSKGEQVEKDVIEIEKIDTEIPKENPDKIENPPDEQGGIDIDLPELEDLPEKS